MWEKKSRHIGLKILLVLICAGLIFALVKGYLYVKEQNKAMDAALLQEYNLRQEQQEAVTVQQSSLDTLTAEYQLDLSTVAEYLPGIVCWGDTLTAGSAGNVSFPYVLQDLIDDSINDKYDFKSTIDNADNYNRVEWDDFEVDIPVVNMGCGEETTGTILARNGAAPFVVSKAFTIPAECEPVQVSFTCADGREANPLTEGDVGVNPVTINGIEGRLVLDLESYSHSSRKNIYTFTRALPGMEVEVQEGVQIITSASEQYRDYIPVIFIGTYGGYDSVQELITQQKQILEHQIGDRDRYIIVGLYYINKYNYLNGGSLTEFEKYEAAMLQEYGSHFINLRKYLVSDGLQDAGITPTKNDTADIKSGVVPTSLKSASTGAELNAAGYKLLGKLVYDRMDKLGYFDEVKDELGITALEKLEKKGLS